MRRETARALAGLSLAVGLVSILLPEAHYQQLLSSISGWLGYEATGSCPLVRDQAGGLCLQQGCPA